MRSPHQADSTVYELTYLYFTHLYWLSINITNKKSSGEKHHDDSTGKTFFFEIVNAFILIIYIKSTTFEQSFGTCCYTFLFSRLRTKLGVVKK